MKSSLNVEQMLTPTEVGRMFGVTAKTITRWETQGKIKALRTPGNHRRYPLSEVRAMLAAAEGEADRLVT